MMDWSAVGVVAAMVWGGVLLAFGVGKIFNAEPQRRREGFELVARPPDPGNLCARCASTLKHKPLPALVFFVCATLATVEAQKPTNDALQNRNLPLRSLRPLRLPQTTVSYAEKMAAGWNARGAWQDSFRLDFDAPWVFPWGTNHLVSVEVLSYGEIRPQWNDTNAVARLGVPVSIVPGLTHFGFEQTPSNSYRFVWTDATVGRVPRGATQYELMTAFIELFRCGDVAVTTNGVTWTIPRELPFAHDGFGQDDEWVAANFTNAAEIAAAGGYAAWVDAQVGEGLTNGLYKLTVSVAEDPLETMQIAVGDCSVAITNAGESVFLLEKGAAYGLAFFPPSTNIAISAVDDIPAVRAASRLRSASAWKDGAWTVEVGTFSCNYVSDMPSARCWWLPTVCGSPDVVHLDPSDPHEEFTTLLIDCPHPEDATFEWRVCEGLVAETPYAQSTRVTAEELPSWRRAWMSVTAWFGAGLSQTSSLNFTVGTNATPQAGVSLSIPRALFANDDDDNGDGTTDCDLVDFGLGENDIVQGAVTFRSDDFTNGTIRISVSDFPGSVYTNEAVSAEVSGSFDIPIEDETDRTIHLYFNPHSWSLYQDPSVTAVWLPENGEPQTSSVPFTVVKPVAETICAETVVQSVLGTNHVYTVNPCGVAVGDDAYFHVKVTPASFPDSGIVWTNHDGRIEFVGGNTGRRVQVRGRAAGDAELEVVIGGRTRQVPTFPLKVVEPQTFKITAWIVADSENNPARPVDEVYGMIAPLNDIYRQVGVSFYLDAVSVTNIPDAYDLLYDGTTNDAWNFDRLVDIGHGTGGIECYFVRTLFYEDGSDGPVGANSSGGIVLTAAAHVATLAHEIGHAFNLCDIYVATREKEKYVFGVNAKDVGNNPINYSCALDDWNGGCHGSGDSGARYYQDGTTMSILIPRLVMYGIVRENDVRRDITCGRVDGVWYSGEGAAKVWHDTDADIGFFSNPFRTESPCHD